MGLKVMRLRLADFQQFRDTTLDFTDPAIGAPASRVCLIGANGTGKSTILRVLDKAVTGAAFVESSGQADVDVDLDGELVQLRVRSTTGRSGTFHGFAPAEAGPDVRLDPRADLVVYAPAEEFRHGSIHLDGPTRWTLQDALARTHRPDGHLHHEISPFSVDGMWTELIAAVHRRRQAREDFENLPENLPRTKAELIRAFDTAHPDPLASLAELWNRILEPAGLYFDAAGARLPVQLTDNLDAHVKVRATGAPLPYGQLSTGMRNFLFRIGHLHLLFFGRTIRRGLVFVDEPENSLFPDFLFTLMEVYEAILAPHPAVQLFVATHNPIVAAQFHPHERIVLEWQDGTVVARKGTAPKGDDPNDVLRKDFGLPEVMGPEGRAKWAEYQRLRQELRG